MILGGGPNRIGQGIEFDYCCVHAAFALKEDDFETIMVNCNPETVSTDYDTSDRLYFEPLTLEDVLHIIHREKPVGVIVQFGGQTPLKLAVPLEKEGVRILGTTPDSIDRAEDRKRFKELLDKLGLLQAESGTAVSCDEAVEAANRIGYPVMVRPSYVLGGRAMEIVYDEESVRNYMSRAVKASPERPVLVDKYLEDAIEIDVDAISDGKTVVVAGIMEHIEEAGVHSGDSACSLPPFSLSPDVIREIDHQARALALELGVIGLMNIQFAVKEGRIYVLEVNPRASRTVPFVSKAIGVPLAKLAARVMAGKTLAELGFTKEIVIKHIAVKEAVFPFAKFPGVDTLLGPEMKSTGEVMGIDTDFGMSFAKSQIAAGNPMPVSGRVFLSVKDKDKPGLLEVAQGLEKAGFTIVATRGTAEYLKKRGIAVETVNKVTEGRPHIVDQITDMQIDFVINTVHGAQAQKDSYSIRRTTLIKGIPYFTTISAAKAAVRGISAIKTRPLQVKIHSGVPRIMTQKIPMTKEGYEKLKAELDRIVKVERAKNIKDIEEARAHGDLSENAEYHAAKERQGHLDAKKRELEHKLAHAQIIDISKLSNEKVVFGATVTLSDTDSGDRKKYMLVGQEEADLKKGKISIQSPVGKALIGHKVGDVVTIKTPAKTVEYEIQEIQIAFE